MSEAAAIAIPPSRRVLLLVPLLLSTTLGMINQTNVVVALPHMQGTFSATREQIAWVLTSYLVTVTILTASTGWIGARFGRKQVYMAALVGFGVTSALCANAPTLETEVLFRLLQGVAAGPIFPVTQSILLDVYPKDRHGEALGLWGVSITIGPVLGPILGGVITEEYGWPWIFYFNVPLAALCLFLVVLWVPETPKAPGRRFDVTGFFAMAVMITAFQLALNRGQTLDWFDSTEIVVATALAAFALYVLAVHTATAKHSFLDPKLFTDRSFALGLLFIVVWAMMVNGPIVLLSLRLQSVDGLPVDAVGYLMAPRGLGGVASMSVVGYMVRRFNPKLIAAFGFSLIAVAGWMMQSWPPQADRADVALSGFILGFGISQAYVSLTVMAMATIAPSQRPDAVSLYSLVANIGMGTGVAVAVFMLSQFMPSHHESMAANVSVFNELFRGHLLPHSWNFGSAKGLMAVNEQVNLQAATQAFNDTFRLITIVAAAALPFVFFLARPTRTAR